MNVLKSLLAVALIGGSIFYLDSCAKDSTQDVQSTLALSASTTTDYVLADPGTSDEFAPCFTYVFPLKVQVGKDVVTVNTQEELDKLLKRNPTTTSRVQILFPYTIKLTLSGEELEISNPKDLEKVLRNCDKTKRDTIHRDTMRMGCYSLVFPLTVKLADGTTQTVNSIDEFNALRKASTTRNGATIQFPFDVILRNGNTVTIKSIEELRELERTCKQRKPGGR